MDGHVLMHFMLSLQAIILPLRMQGIFEKFFIKGLKNLGAKQLISLNDEIVN